MTKLEVKLEVVPSRELFWFDLVVSVAGVIFRHLGKYRTQDEAEEAKSTYKLVLG